jgi:hypothetical protein
MACEKSEKHPSGDKTRVDFAGLMNGLKLEPFAAGS